MEKRIVVNEILNIAKSNLSDIEHKHVKQYIDNENFNGARAYLENCVETAQRRVLESIYIDKFDEVYANRYRVMKTLDNKVTYICQELIN